jgi:hypothetical protein
MTVRKMASAGNSSNIFRECAVSPEEQTQDPQDKAFGAAASRDQDIVDELEKEGVIEDELPDEPARHPGAAGKADPA